MRVVIQRVREAKVMIAGKEKSACGKGLVILIGIEENDSAEDAEWLVKKIALLRIFPDSNELMNLSIADADGEIMIVSQFTLFASTKKGNRPSFIRSAKPEQAIQLYELFIQRMESETGKKIHTGEFGAMMEVHLVNDGPVTILMDSKNKE